jgi:hypothetical protein
MATERNFDVILKVLMYQEPILKEIMQKSNKKLYNLLLLVHSDSTNL